MLPTLALTLAAVIAAGCGRADIRKGMVRLDRAFIPALSLTNDADSVHSKAALATLTEKWQRFVDRYRSWARTDRQWRPDLNRVEILIKRASLQAESGELSAAHEALESVRDVMLDMRRRNGVEYLPDYLTEYHHVMERLVSAGAGRSPRTLNAAALDSIAADYALARDAWARIVSFGIDGELYGFDDQKLAAAKAQIMAESEALDRLATALDAHDQAAVLEAVARIKPEFASLYKMFGDYKPVR